MSPHDTWITQYIQEYMKPLQQVSAEASVIWGDCVQRAYIAALKQNNTSESSDQLNY